MCSRSTLVLIVALSAASCSDDVGLPDARPPTDAAVPGQLSFSWTVGYMSAALTCAELGASSVAVEIVPQGAVFGVVDSFSCASGMGTSRQLAPGTYDLTISLEGAGGTLGGPILRLGAIVASSETRAVDPVAFEVEPFGDLVFRISTGTNGNCTAEASGGAGITATRIELRDSAGTCVPTTFTISAGASQPGGTYVSDCAAATHACIATDQDVSAADVRAGQHSMVLTGLVDGQACWRRTSSFVVRSNDLTTTLNPQLLIRDTVLCPPP